MEVFWWIADPWEELKPRMWLEQEQAQVVEKRGRLWRARAVGQVPEPSVTIQMANLVAGMCPVPP